MSLLDPEVAKHLAGCPVVVTTLVAWGVPCLFAALALGAVRREEIRALVGVERVFVPDPSRRALYDRLYAEFPRLYKRQRSMFARLSRHPSSVNS